MRAIPQPAVSDLRERGGRKPRTRPSEAKQSDGELFYTRMATFIIGAAFLSAATALGQPGPGRGGAGGSGPRLYNPATVETVSGVVQRVEQVKGKAKGGGYGIHLLLKTEKEEIAVHLGPGWYLEKQPIKFAPQDQVEVRGSRITYEGKPVIVAVELKKGDQVLKLRDAAGRPLWRGQGRPGS